jgi:hypothetical protein
MTSNNTHFRSNKGNQIIQKKLQKVKFNKHEIESGFKQRKPRKIKGKLLLISFLSMAMQGKNTIQQWAEQMGLMTGKTVSKQGIWKRINQHLCAFLSAVLLDILEQQMKEIRGQFKSHTGFFHHYKRVLLQDSTTIALPAWLKWCYPGNVSRGEKKAQLKIQVVFDIVHNCFVHFETTAFSANDQSKSRDIVFIANHEDLVIRDLGYFVLDSFELMKHQCIKFISRLKYGNTIYDINTGNPINLLKVLRKKGWFDQWVMIGTKQKLKVRMVAIKLTAQQASDRRRKARNDRDKRLNHGKLYYEMLDYHFFITSEDDSLLTSKQITELYGLRWRIETIFKCWKSHFFIQKLIPQKCSITKERADAIIYMILIFILLFQVTFFNYLVIQAKKRGYYLISLIRLCKFVSNHFELMLLKDPNPFIPQILYYCCYDKRLDRQNYLQKLNLS